MPGYNWEHYQPGYVYFIQAGKRGPVKIGWSENPSKRLEVLQHANAEVLMLRRAIPGTRKLECEIHRTLRAARMQREWFRWSEALERMMNRPSHVSFSESSLRGSRDIEDLVAFHRTVREHEPAWRRKSSVVFGEALTLEVVRRIEDGGGRIFAPIGHSHDEIEAEPNWP